jgi:hypothetical protein
VDYEDYDKNLYTSARKRTTTDDSAKILFYALEIKFTEAQLMVAPTDVMAFILQKYLFTQIFHPLTLV